MISYLRYYFSAEGQSVANAAWEANGKLMHSRHENETAIANEKWRKQREADDAESKAFTQSVFNFLGIKQKA